MATYTSGEPSKRVPFLEAGDDFGLAVIGATAKTSSKGNDMIELKLEVVDVAGEELEEETGPILYECLTFIPSVAWKIDQFRLAMGEEVIEGEEVDVDPDELLGVKVRASLTVGQTNKGKTRNEIGEFLAPTDGVF